MLPLAERLGFCTEELSEHVNDTVAGLMNASMGNAPELIIALFALSTGKIDVVKESLIGSVLSNLLLVLGSALIMGGSRVHLQSFNNVLSPQNASLLLACCLAVFMPTTLVSSGLELRVGAALLVSRVCSVFLLVLYGVYLVFQLKTHSELFDDDEEEEGVEDAEKGITEGSPLTAGVSSGVMDGSGSSGNSTPPSRGKGDTNLLSSVAVGGGSSTSSQLHSGAGAEGAGGSAAAAATGLDLSTAENGTSDDLKSGAATALPSSHGPPENEHLTLVGSVFGLAICAALVAYVSDILVGAISGASEAWGISAAFVAAMLVPIAGNAAEHTSALIFAYKDRLDLALGICVGSAVQIYAFVLPLLVVVGWIINQPMGLDFKPFEFGLLVFAVLITSFSLLPGKSNYLAGIVHLMAYAMMATGYLLYSGPCGVGTEEVFTSNGSTCKLIHPLTS